MKRLLSYFIIILLLSGCVQKVRTVWTDVPSAESLLSHMETLPLERNSLDTEAKVSLTVNGKYYSTQQFILVQKPEQLRSDILTGFGQLIMQVSVNRNELSAFMNDTVPGRFYHGPASPENIARFVRIPLQLKDLISFLLQTPPVIVHNSASVTVQGDMLLMTLNRDSQKQEIVFDSQLRVCTVRYFLTEDVQLQVDYDRFDSGGDFPHRVKINLPEHKLAVTVAMEEPLLNTAVSEDKFSLTAPEGALIESL